MNKVYLVFDGSYSDRNLIGVFSTQEKAEAAKILYNANNDVEEWEIDSKTCELSSDLLPYYVTMVGNGDVRSVYRVSIESNNTKLTVYNRYVSLNVEEPAALIPVMARDEKHAVKIAADIRRKLMASDNWILDPIKFEEKFKVRAYVGIDI